MLFQVSDGLFHALDILTEESNPTVTSVAKYATCFLSAVVVVNRHSARRFIFAMADGANSILGFQ